MTRRALLDVVEGFYAGSAVWTLHRIGAIARLRSGATPAELARDLDCDEQLLTAILEFVFHTTDLLARTDGRYELASAYRGDHRLEFQLDKFVGAYGACIRDLADVLAEPAKGAELRDHAALARAFEQLVPHRPSLTRRVLEEWGVSSLFDLGCGTGSLLIELAEADPSFRGWGVDASASMVSAAVANVQRASVAARVQISQGDVQSIDPSTAPPSRDDVQALYGRSILNEFFAHDGAEAVNVLRSLKRWFPDRLFFVEDYYGCLTRDVGSIEGRRHTLLQDLAQAFSGQGVPPPNLAGWQHTYDSSGCSLVKGYEGTNDGIAWFIHVVRL